MYMAWGKVRLSSVNSVTKKVKTFTEQLRVADFVYSSGPRPPGRIYKFWLMVVYYSSVPYLRLRVSLVSQSGGGGRVGRSGFGKSNRLPGLRSLNKTENLQPTLV